MEWRERLQTIAATALFTSLAWILFGSWWWLNNRPASAPPLTAPGAAPVPSATLAPARSIAPAGPGGLVIPVQGVRADQLVDTYTQARAGGARRHDAIDIMASRGTPVLAAAPGTVEKLFVSKDGGNTVYVRSPDRKLMYYYAHLDSYASGLAENQSVRAGQVLGYVGFSGNANPAGPHLHMAINRMRPDDDWWKGEPINPYPLLVAGSVPAK
jgi:peptidoglycan LD-endopeptidase LytH